MWVGMWQRARGQNETQNCRLKISTLAVDRTGSKISISSGRILTEISSLHDVGNLYGATPLEPRWVRVSKYACPLVLVVPHPWFWPG
jgi:hypothetical protein